MSSVQVTSEIGRLRRVLVHEPGPEVDHMLPSMMEELLFDDILFGEAARKEHRRFRRVLEALGVEVLDAHVLLAAAFRREEARHWVLDPLQEALAPALLERLRAASPAELARALTSGVRRELAGSGNDADDLFEIPPVPNVCFQRDPQVVIGHEVLIAAMATPARQREALLADVVFRFHPDLAAVPRLYEPTTSSYDQSLSLGPQRPRFEGGDVLVLSPEVVAVGVSQRTNRTGVQLLVRALARREQGPRWLILVALPALRAYMHLDTVITPIDRDACLVYPPLVESGGPGAARVFEIDLHAKDSQPAAQPDLLAALRRRQLDFAPIPCGGSDPVLQQREQWTDGANALAVAPGVVVLYDRNVATAEELGRHGFAIVGAKELLQGRSPLDVESGKRACVLVGSNEICRARGGPHCLTHPLFRDPV